MTDARPGDLRLGQTVEFTRRGIVTEEWSGCSGGYVTLAAENGDTVLVPCGATKPWGTVKVLPDPLPTRPGTHIVATVTRGCVFARTSLVLDPSRGAWHSAWRVGGEYWHDPEHISDWRVLDVEDGTP